MTEIKISTYEEFKAAFPKVLEKKNFYESDYSKVLVAYAEKAGVCFVTPGTRYYVRGFNWNAAKSTFYYAYSTAEKAEAKANYFLSAKIERLARVAERRKERSKGHSLEINDVLSASWGYNQTNVDYYKVVKTTKCTVDLVKIPKVRIGPDKVSPDTSPSSATLPVLQRKRVSEYGYVKIDSSRTAGKCNPGDTHYETPFGMGH